LAVALGVAVGVAIGLVTARVYWRHLPHPRPWPTTGEWVTVMAVLPEEAQAPVAFARDASSSRGRASVRGVSPLVVSRGDDTSLVQLQRWCSTGTRVKLVNDAVVHRVVLFEPRSRARLSLECLPQGSGGAQGR
jgi:hypothetical protein